MRRVVEVFTRASCGLCREAEHVVTQVAAERADIRLIDVDADPVLTDRYGVRVPVVAIDGVEVAEGIVDGADLLAVLER